MVPWVETGKTYFFVDFSVIIVFIDVTTFAIELPRYCNDDSAMFNGCEKKDSLNIEFEVKVGVRPLL